MPRRKRSAVLLPPMAKTDEQRIARIAQALLEAMKLHMQDTARQCRCKDLKWAAILVSAEIDKISRTIDRPHQS